MKSLMNENTIKKSIERILVDNKDAHIETLKHLTMTYVSKLFKKTDASKTGIASISIDKTVSEDSIDMDYKLDISFGDNLKIGLTNKLICPKG